MILQQHIWRTAAAAVQVLALMGATSVAVAQTGSMGTGQQGGGAAGSTGSAQSSAVKHVTDATAVVSRMSSETGMGKLLSQAKGLYVVPTYGRAALGLGASGGAGVLLVKRADGTWSDPAFFNIGGLSVGLQAGAEGGAIAMVLLNDKAVDSFRKKNNFSLSADAGLTVLNWSKMAQGNPGKGDVVVWAGSKGLFGNVATIAVNDIHFNERATESYYGKAMTVQDVMDGKATSPQSDPLKQAVANASGSAR
jgi:lipid-binding SYLF domain-containing protein